ncbi:MAG: hypothetical protein K9L89_02385 [Kiritimatiellales bacterium]|nr:hypothetical protein [Kiritimatiellales bacterium]
MPMPGDGSILDWTSRDLHIAPMKKNLQKPTDSPVSSAKKNPARGSLIATGAMFLIVVLLWKDSSQTKSAMQKLAEQNAQQRETLAAVQSELKAANTELDFFKTGEFGKPMADKVAKVAPVVPKPVEEPETLLLQAPTVQQTAAGLVARFEFTPNSTELPGQITLVVRIPADSDAKILSLKPVAKPSYTSVECVVDAKGKLGMVEGSPADLQALAFELTVSEPVKALVRGSKGIKAFELDIAPSGCTVRKL